MMRIRKFLKYAVIALLIAALLIPAAARKDNAAQAEKKVPRIIVSLGDSYGSGEGNEPFYGQELPMSERMQNKEAWEDWLAHRSKLAWSGQLYINDDERGLCVPVIRNETWFFAAASGAETCNIVRTPYNSDPYHRVHDGELEKYFDRDGYSGTYYLPGQLNIFYDNGGAFDRNDVDYVTVSIGGNDVGFVEILKLAAMKGPFSSELYDNIDNKLLHFYDKGSTHDDILEAYLRIHKAAPNATIIVVGYPRLLSYFSNVTYLGHMGCPLFNIAECRYIDNAVSLFNKRLEKLVEECRDIYGVDIVFCPIEPKFNGHEAYSILQEPYIRRIEFGKNDQDLTERINIRKKDFISHYSMHPNESGQRVYAACVNDTIQRIEEKRNGSTDGSDETSVREPWLEVYRRFIAGREYLSVSAGKFWDEEPHRFGLFDLDGNGVPELIIYNGNTSHADSGCVVYAYKGNVAEIGEISCSYPEGGYVGLSYIGSRWYPGLFFNDYGTGLSDTEYFTVGEDGAVTRETVELLDWEEGRLLKRTSDDALYSRAKRSKFKSFVMYTYEEIMDLDWSVFSAKQEQTQYADIWTAIDRSGVCRYFSMTYEEVRREAGELECVWMSLDELLPLSYTFRDLPGYDFCFEADFYDAVGDTDFFVLSAAEAEPYIYAQTPCSGICVYTLSQLGFVGTVDAKTLGATVYDFTDICDSLYAEVEHDGRKFLFNCDENGIITEDDVCWILLE